MTNNNTYQVPSSGNFDFSALSTKPSKKTDKKALKKQLKKEVEAIAELQHRLYAEDKRSIL